VDRGTGLGLAIVYSVLQKMGGTVDVHSVPGEGATFDLYLPAAADEAADDAAWRLSTDLPQGTGRVLVVEDQDDVRDLAVHMISDLGYEVEAAANGAEAITLVQSGRRYDLVVSDVVMPGMSGPAMVTYLRRLLGDVAAVYVSGYASEAALERGGDEDLVIVHKPFTIEALATAMHQALVTDV